MTALEHYLAAFPPMHAGKVRKALERQQGFNNQFYPRHKYAEILATSPCSRVDYDKGRVYTAEDGRFFEIKDVTLTFADYLVWLKDNPRI